MEREYKDIKELIEWLTEISMSNEKYVFRGYSKNNQMQPTIMRNNMCNKELKLLALFERYSSPLINIINPFDLVVCAQHYGLFTRLLDFTYNPFIALFFAISFSNENDEESWVYIRYSKVSDNILLNHFPTYNDCDIDYNDDILDFYQKMIKNIQGLYDENYLPEMLKLSIELGEKLTHYDFVEEYLRKIIEVNYLIDYSDLGDMKKKLKENTILFIDPNQSNTRLNMQQGLFMLPYTLDKEKHNKIIENNTALIKINKSLKPEIIQYLDKMGINSFRLMPDLSNICHNINKQFS